MKSASEGLKRVEAEIDSDETDLDKYLRNGKRWSDSFVALAPCTKCSAVRFWEFHRTDDKPDSMQVEVDAGCTGINRFEEKVRNCSHKKEEWIMAEARFNILRIHPNPIC